MEEPDDLPNDVPRDLPSELSSDVASELPSDLPDELPAPPASTSAAEAAAASAPAAPAPTEEAPVPETTAPTSYREQLPPYDLELESSALGALLFNSNQDQRDEFFGKLKEHDFFKHAHQIIFSVLHDLDKKVSSLDLTTLSEELRSRGVLKNVGGISYIASLTMNIPSSVNLPYYAQQIHGYSIRRQMLSLAQDLTHQVYKYDTETNEILAEAEKRMLALAEYGSDLHQFLDAETLVEKTFKLIEERHEHPGEFTGVTSGFPELDQMTLGFQPSEMIIIGARPSVGKTALALSMILHMGALQKVPVGVFSLEMNGISLMERLLAAQAQINSHHLRSGLLGSQEMRKLAENVNYLYKAPIFIDDTPNISLLDLRTRARRMVKRHEVKILFIDYIGLINLNNSNQPRHEQMAEISMNIKALARELEVPVVALSQVGRQTEGKAPGLSDLRGSGALEQDADVVMYLHRERAAGEQNSDEDIKTDLIVAKQRNGPVGNVELMFVPKYARFVSLKDNPPSV